jgi:hypothetical protein
MDTNRTPQLATRESRGTPLTDGTRVLVTLTGQPTPRGARGIVDSSCYHYVTRTVKGSRPMPDGTWERYDYTETVRVPFITPRAERVAKPRPKPEARRAPEAARIKLDHDYNEQ